MVDPNSETQPMYVARCPGVVDKARHEVVVRPHIYQSFEEKEGFTQCQECRTYLAPKPEPKKE